MTRFHFSLLAALIAPLPIWCATRPPLLDLPQHTAQVAALLQMLRGDWAFQGLFDTQFFMPYLTGFAVMGLFAQLFSIVTAAKLTLTLALSGLIAATACLLKSEKSDPAWVWLLAPASYGFAFNWGFLNFLVAAPLGVLLLQQGLAYARAPSLRHGVWLALLTHAVFFSHVMVLLFFGALAGIAVLYRSPGLKAGLLRSFPLWCIAAMGLAWGLPGLGNEQAQWPVQWYLGWQRLAELPELLVGERRSVAVAVLAVLLFLLPLLGGARPSRDPVRLLPFLCATLAVLLLPLMMAGTYYSYQRFALFLLPMYLLALDPPATRPRVLLDAGLVAVALLWTGMTAARFAAFDDESRAFEPILARMEPQRRMLSLVFEPGSRFRNAPVYMHYPAWYQAEKLGLAEFNFAKFEGMLLHYREPPVVNEDLAWWPDTFSWGYHHGERYDYIVVQSASDQPPFNDNPEVLRLTLHSGNWWLYERPPPAQ